MIFRSGVYRGKRTEVAKSAKKGRGLILRKRVAGFLIYKKKHMQKELNPKFYQKPEDRKSL